MTADGHLAFVINDAVVTDRFAPARPLCTDATRARAAAERRALAADLAHNLAVQPPALAAYGDNAGGFMVAIRRGACPAASTMRYPAVARRPVAHQLGSWTSRPPAPASEP
jgi:hypothetical protein